MQQLPPTDPIASGGRTGFYLANEDQSAVSWPAVFAGGVVTAALSLIMLALGTGLGFASTSLLPGRGASASALNSGAVLWVIFIQLVSASMGGYLAGRLRTKWKNVHTDEVYFRDTAHGFLAWSTALVVSAAFLTTTAASFTNSRTPEESSVKPSSDYFVDLLFRSDGSKPATEIAAVNRDAATVFTFSLAHGALSSADKAYLDRLVMDKTGASQADASTRVTEVYQEAQSAVETARKALAHTLLWTFIALLVGAFCASFAGTIGGRQRDHELI